MGPTTKAVIAIYLIFALYSGFAAVSVAHNNSQVISTTIHFSASIQNINVTYDTIQYPDGANSYKNFRITADILMSGRDDPLDVRVYDVSYSVAIMVVEEGEAGMKSVGSFNFYSMADPVIVNSGQTITYHTSVNITDQHFAEVINSSYNRNFGYWLLSGGLNYQISGFENLPKNSIMLSRDYSDAEVMQ